MSVFGGNVLEAVLEATLHGQRVANVLGFYRPENWDTASITNLATALTTWINSYLKVITSDQVRYRQWKMTNLNAPGLPSLIFPIEVQGELTSPAMPGNVTTVMSLHTPLGGRSYRGRIYHFGLTEATCDNNSLLSTSVAPFVSAYSHLLDSAISTIGQLSVVSRRTGGAERESLVATPVNSITNDGWLDSQRRRLTGRGR